MALNLMYITNDPKVAVIAEKSGVNRIFVDMEYIGKSLRQSGMDTVQFHHTLEDVKNVKKVLHSAELLVRVNPIHDATKQYSSSKEEIDAVIKAGADIIMLPYFKTIREVQFFLDLVADRAKTVFLLETPEAVKIVDQILEIPRVEQIHIGLNDLSLGYGKKFMFELLIDGTVEKLCQKFKSKGITYGFGGIASLGGGKLPAEDIIKEHYREGSTCAILSRSFCNTSIIRDYDRIEKIFINGVKAIREFEYECENNLGDTDQNHRELKEKILMICANIDA